MDRAFWASGAQAVAESEPQINEHPAFQAGFWRVQRIAWAGLLGMVGMALLGLTGGGGRFSQDIVADEAFSVRYPAILRLQTEGSFVVTKNTPSRQMLLHFDRTFQETFAIVALSPPPLDAFATPGGVAYRFALSGSGPAAVRITVLAERPFAGSYAIVADGRMALLSTTVLP